MEQNLNPEQIDGNFPALSRYRIREGDVELQAHARFAKENTT